MKQLKELQGKKTSSWLEIFGITNEQFKIVNFEYVACQNPFIKPDKPKKEERSAIRKNILSDLENAFNKVNDDTAVKEFFSSKDLTSWLASRVIKTLYDKLYGSIHVKSLVKETKSNY